MKLRDNFPSIELVSTFNTFCFVISPDSKKSSCGFSFFFIIDFMKMHLYLYYENVFAKGIYLYIFIRMFIDFIRYLFLLVNVISYY